MVPLGPLYNVDRRNFAILSMQDGATAPIFKFTGPGSYFAENSQSNSSWRVMEIFHKWLHYVINVAIDYKSVQK